MADTMQFDLVSPERRLASVEAHQVVIPGAEGEFTAMPNHARVMTTLRPGVLKVSGPDGEAEFVVIDGFAEVTEEGASVLAENARPMSEVTGDYLEGLLIEAREQAESATPETLDQANKHVADLQALRDQLRL